MIVRLARSSWHRYGVEVRERADAEAALHRATVSSAEVNRRLAVVFLTTIACLTFVRFVGNESDTRGLTSLLAALGLDGAGRRLTWAMEVAPDRRLYGRVLWATARVVGYAVLPLLALRFALREPARGFGVRVRGVFDATHAAHVARHAPVYLLIIAVLAPVVFGASFGAAFQAKYPYYKLAAGEALWPAFWAWEALYGVQFIALEFFFRGFLVHGLRPALGYSAIFVMMVPYTMIHFGKPLPEAIGSIIAGFALGTLSLKSESIWGGAVVHIAVACSMDLLSLWHRGLI